MSTRQMMAYSVFLLLLGLPMIALPFVGRQILERLDISNNTTNLTKPTTDPSMAVSLVTSPLVGLPGEEYSTLVAMLDLNSREAVANVCEKSAYLSDALQVYASKNPNRINPVRKIVDNDPELVRFLNETFPTFFISKARMTKQMAYQDRIRPMDVYECSGYSFRRIAAKTTE